ncbi:MAG TPA: PAS domain-containing protein [Chitinophagaceae bacterium]|nr:PAS domain-containing protein [Chitinophagaceae bacterium]
MNTKVADKAFFANAETILALFLSGVEERLFMVDRQLIIRTLNDAAKRFTKKPDGSSVEPGTSVLELARSSEEADFYKAIYADVFNGHSYTSAEISHGVANDIFQYRIRPAALPSGEIVAAVVIVYDITKKHETENALKASEERLRFAMEGSDHGIWDWNIKSGALHFSPSWLKMLGYEQDELKNSIDEWEKRIHPDDKEQLTRDLATHYTSDQPTYENSYRLLAKDGTYRYILGRGKIVERDADGTPTRMIGTHTDVTQKRKSEEQYRNLFEINPLPTWIYNYETLHIIAVNKAAIVKYGYTKEEFLNLTIFDLQPPEQQQLLEQRIRERDEETVKPYPNWHHKKKNGEIIVAEISGTTIIYNDVKARLIVVNDITEKVAVEEELRRSNERYQYVTKATSDAIYDVDLVTGNLTWGKGFTSLFGYATLLSTLSEWETLIHPDERKSVSESFTETIYNSRKKLWKMEYRFLEKGGAYRHVIDKGFIVRDENEKPVRVIGAIQDITNLKEQQLELIESNNRYEYATLAIAEIIWDWSLEKDCILWSDNYEKLTGWKLPDNKCITVETGTSRFHESDRDRVWKSMNDALQNEDQITWEAEFKYKKANGDIAFMYNRAYILRDKNGIPQRVIGAMQDITQRKMLEEQLLQKELDKQRVISKATIDTQERERSEIGKELHDNVNQILTTTKLYLELALGKPELKDELLQKSQKNIMYVINEIRQLSCSLMNPSLGDLGLVDSITDLIENIQATEKLHIIFQCAETIDAEIPDHLKLTIYRIIQETLNNAVKHANASTVVVSISKEDNDLHLYIEDNGVGFEPEITKKGSGLKNIKNRVYLNNGTYNLISKPGAGCAITIHFNMLNITIH